MVVLIWTVYLPLTHWLTVPPGQGIVPALGGIGAGAAGGWWAAVIYVALLAGLTGWRWHSRRWMQIRLGIGNGDRTVVPTPVVTPPPAASGQPQRGGWPT